MNMETPPEAVRETSKGVPPSPVILSEDRFEFVVGPRRPERIVVTLFNRSGEPLPCRLSTDQEWLSIEGDAAFELGESREIVMVADPRRIGAAASAVPDVAGSAVARMQVTCPGASPTIVVRVKLLRRWIRAAAGIGAMFGLVPTIGEIAMALLLLWLLVGARGPADEDPRSRNERLRDRYTTLSMLCGTAAAAAVRWLTWQAWT